MYEGLASTATDRCSGAFSHNAEDLDRLVQALELAATGEYEVSWHDRAGEFPDRSGYQHLSWLREGADAGCDVDAEPTNPPSCPIDSPASMDAKFDGLPAIGWLRASLEDVETAAKGRTR